MAIFRSIRKALAADSVLKDAHRPVTTIAFHFHLVTSNMSQYDNLLNVLFKEPVWSAAHEEVRQFNDHDSPKTVLRARDPQGDFRAVPIHNV